jgi:hypothetical protein
MLSSLCGRPIRDEPFAHCRESIRRLRSPARPSIAMVAITPGAGRPPSSAVAAESLGLLGVVSSSGGMTERLIEVDLPQESVAVNMITYDSWLLHPTTLTSLLQVAPSGSIIVEYPHISRLKLHHRPSRKLCLSKGKNILLNPNYHYLLLEFL